MANNDHIERTKRMIEVMQAYVDGEDIEFSYDEKSWQIVEEPSFSNTVYYRIAKTPDTINWDHVSPEFKYMARNSSGFCYLFTEKPKIGESAWDESDAEIYAEHFTSYRKGTVDWKESLVFRPGCE